MKRFILVILCMLMGVFAIGCNGWESGGWKYGDEVTFTTGNSSVGAVSDTGRISNIYITGDNLTIILRSDNITIIQDKGGK